MAQKGIREFHSKKILSEQIEEISNAELTCHGKAALISSNFTIDEAATVYPWLKKEGLVVKPDQLFGKRGKNDLIYAGAKQSGASFEEAKEWIKNKLGTKIKLLSGIEGKLTHFLVEPYTFHDKEYYIAITGNAKEDIIQFSCQGGVEVEEKRDSIATVAVKIEDELTDEIAQKLLADIEENKKQTFIKLVKSLLIFVRENHIASFELNPFTIKGNELVVMDAVVKVDDTAQFLCAEKWGNLPFPASFGTDLSPAEQYIRDLDQKTGASLKLSLLNLKGKVWTMVAGGGASVIYADTVVDLGKGSELANYGEYSGNPTTEDTCEYARTLLKLMTENNGKVLIIGGGIANFTDVAKTFKGIILALTEYAEKIKKHDIRIFVRRGGPNYKKGLEVIKEAGEKLGINLQAYGPESHMTRIVKLALEVI